jgi:alkylhydroperoxidase family enzyme
VGSLRVAHLTNAAYQRHEHTAVAMRLGFTAEKIDAIATYTSQDPGVILDQFERTLIEFTDAVVITANAPDELFDAVRTDYNDSRVVELVLLIGFYMMVARVMNTFQLELETEKVDNYHLRLD